MPKSLDASKGRATLPRHPYHVTTGTAPAVPGPESGGPSNAHNDDDDVNMDSDPDYTSVTEGAKPIHRRRKRAYNPSLRKLDRKQRALCRELHFRQQRQSRDLAKIFSVTEATIKRVVYNEYANSGKDNLDSDHEYIKDGDVLRKLTQLDRLPTRMPTCAASSRGSKCTSQRGAIRPSPPTSSKRGRPAKAEKAPVRPAGMDHPADKRELARFLGNLGFTDAQILAVLPPLEEGGITDDETFRQVLNWPESDIDQLIKELESNKRLNTVQKIRIKRGIYDRRKEMGLPA